MNEAVDRLIAERERLDAGMPRTLLASLVGHLVLIASAIALPALLPKEPPLRVADGFAVVLPRGGGVPSQPPPAAVPPSGPGSTLPAAPPKVLKPPTKEAPHPKALPAPDARRTARKAPEPNDWGTPAAPTSRAATAGAGSPMASGLALGPAGPGLPNGTETGGDWYLAGVQQKIWIIWTQQIRTDFTQPVGVTFTILPDGSVSNAEVTQSSGASLLDTAAKRAVLLAAPFSPLPKEYGANGRTIQAVFSPVS